MKSRVSVVYFAEAKDLCRVKIGFSVNAASRLLAMSSGTPAPLILLGTIPGDCVVDSEMHERFKSKHIHGEWFVLDDAMRSEIESLITERRGRVFDKSKKLVAHQDFRLMKIPVDIAEELEGWRDWFIAPGRVQSRMHDDLRALWSPSVGGEFIPVAPIVRLAMRAMYEKYGVKVPPVHRRLAEKTRAVFEDESEVAPRPTRKR